MNLQDVLIILSSLLTGCIASIIGAIFAFHARFIRLETQMKTVRSDIRAVRRHISRDLYENQRTARLYVQDETQEMPQWQRTVGQQHGENQH